VHALLPRDLDRALWRILEEQKTFGLPAGQWALTHVRDPKDMPRLAMEKGVELGTAAVEQPASSLGLNPLEAREHSTG